MKIKKKGKHKLKDSVKLHDEHEDEGGERKGPLPPSSLPPGPSSKSFVELKKSATHVFLPKSNMSNIKM
jgi:hypothetical protein